MAYVVAQRQTGTIYGVGATKPAAVRDANKFLEYPVSSKMLEQGRPDFGDLTIERADKGVTDLVKIAGGNSNGRFYFYGGKYILTADGKETLKRRR